MADQLSDCRGDTSIVVDCPGCRRVIWAGSLCGCELRRPKPEPYRVPSTSTREVAERFMGES